MPDEGGGLPFEVMMPEDITFPWRVHHGGVLHACKTTPFENEVFTSCGHIIRAASYLFDEASQIPTCLACIAYGY